MSKEPDEFSEEALALCKPTISYEAFLEVIEGYGADVSKGHPWFHWSSWVEGDEGRADLAIYTYWPRAIDLDVAIKDVRKTGKPGYVYINNVIMAGVA